jgi:hypothetical protein
MRSVQQRRVAEVQLALQLVLEAVEVGTGVGIGADGDHQAARLGEDGEGHGHIARGHSQRENAGDGVAEEREGGVRTFEIADECVDQPLVVDEVLIDPEPGE